MGSYIAGCPTRCISRAPSRPKAACRERAGQHRGFVRQNIAEQIVRSKSHRIATGARSSCMAQLSAYICDSSTSLYSAACSLVTSSRQSRPDSITLAFSQEQTLLRRLRGQFERDARNADNFGRRINLRIDPRAFQPLPMSVIARAAPRNKPRRSIRARS